MGVSGLSSFMEKFPLYQYCPKIEIEKGMSILVDASALSYYLYQRKLALDWMLCGEYQDFSSGLVEFVNVFKTIGVKHMCFCFDGILDPKKKNTARERSIRKAINANVVTQPGFDKFSNSSLFLRPQNITSLMKFSLRRHFMTLDKKDDDFKVSIVSATHEADPLLAKMLQTKEFRVVLSDDSDFYIFSLPKGVGYAPFRHLQFATLDEDPTGKMHAYVLSIETQDVVRILGLKNARYLPLLPCLAGCDYVEQEHLRSIWLYMKNSVKKRNPKSFEIIVPYLSTHAEGTPEEVIEKLFKQIQQQNRKSVMDDAIGALNHYRGTFRAEIVEYTGSLSASLREVFTYREIFAPVSLEKTDMKRDTSYSLLINVRRRIYELAAFKDESITEDTVTINEVMFRDEKVTERPIAIRREDYVRALSHKTPIELFYYIWGIALPDTTENINYRQLYLVALFTTLKEIQSNDQAHYTLSDCRKLLLSLFHFEINHDDILPNMQTFQREQYQLVSMFTLLLNLLQQSVSLLGFPDEPVYDTLCCYSGRRLYSILDEELLDQELSSTSEQLFVDTCFIVDL